MEKMAGLTFMVIAFSSVIMYSIDGEISFAVSAWGALIMSKLFFDA